VKVRPRLLDLYCSAGGAAWGYCEAGFTVVGVDIAPQPRYPFRFVQADAFDYVARHGHEFQVIHASPPCQAYSPLNSYNHKTYPDDVAGIRAALKATGVPYVIENIMRAPLQNPVMLCGGMFGLRVYRHRGFEASIPLRTPQHPPHVTDCARNGYLPTGRQYMTITGGKHSTAWRERAAQEMRVGWMRTTKEVCEAIPPAYARYIGGSFRRHVR
jgi:DNA (cytosine-5)-methyltransferase 1